MKIVAKCLLVLDSKEVRVSHYYCGVWGRVVPLTKEGRSIYCVEFVCKARDARNGSRTGRGSAPVAGRGFSRAQEF